ncbi:CPXCG motif-containing cysteine-rich protein [Aestuariibacter sp. AA17]|uniref:CPXCG motif-containing cysteine-rich protein n=2 Tax=Fluctibacter corallii TaxID=2984329 RepID=A0ABT3A988_9ALTE|nr:CPXCG motif-containing cysteine-rich protein [Aestuariibacter sp. AA17]MCV2885170.1 CPXCG motif-containing cysteine-rich protein [Aestuariibacter sp. AA17]
METKSATIECPHCGHSMHISIDYSNGDQDYFEDCPNCCNNVHISLHMNETKRRIDICVMSDDEQVY